MLQEAKDKVANHHAGRSLLEDSELEMFTRRVDVYGRKLERMKEPLDESVRIKQTTDGTGVYVGVSVSAVFF